WLAPRLCRRRCPRSAVVEGVLRPRSGRWERIRIRRARTLPSAPPSGLLLLPRSSPFRFLPFGCRGKIGWARATGELARSWIDEDWAAAPEGEAGPRRVARLDLVAHRR